MLHFTWRISITVLVKTKYTFFHNNHQGKIRNHDWWDHRLFKNHHYCKCKQTLMNTSVEKLKKDKVWLFCFYVITNTNLVFSHHLPDLIYPFLIHHWGNLTSITFFVYQKIIIISTFSSSNSSNNCLWLVSNNDF